MAVIMNCVPVAVGNDGAVTQPAAWRLARSWVRGSPVPQGAADRQACAVVGIVVRSRLLIVLACPQGTGNSW